MPTPNPCWSARQCDADFRDASVPDGHCGVASMRSVRTRAAGILFSHAVPGTMDGCELVVDHSFLDVLYKVQMFIAYTVRISTPWYLVPM